MLPAVLRDLCRGRVILAVATCLAVTSPGRSLEIAPLWRIVSWNVANGPMTIADEEFRTVLTMSGRNRPDGLQRIDILTLTETDTDSAEIIKDMMNDLYGVDSYRVHTARPDGAGDRTGIVYDASLFSLVSQDEIFGDMTHPVMVGQFRPVRPEASEDLIVYSISLKSGAERTDIDMRQREAIRIRDHVNSWSNAGNILFAGTFSMLGADEPGYAVLSQPGVGAAVELIDVPEEWRGNSQLAAYHTQDPRNMLDDRFDMQLATSDLSDSVGIEYFAGSYHVVGNSGTHDIGKSLLSGRIDDLSEMVALITASDHLPVAADYWLIPRLQAGDADQDYDMDQLDLVQVLRFGKYLSGATATWGEGDWNGAPGGGPTVPPVGDGSFDQLDLVATLTHGLYLSGAYAEVPFLPREAALTAVPEPASLGLLVVALVTMIFRMRKTGSAVKTT